MQRHCVEIRGTLAEKKKKWIFPIPAWIQHIQGQPNNLPLKEFDSRSSEEKCEGTDGCLHPGASEVPLRTPNSTGFFFLGNKESNQWIPQWCPQLKTRLKKREVERGRGTLWSFVCLTRFCCQGFGKHNRKFFCGIWSSRGVSLWNLGLWGWGGAEGPWHRLGSEPSRLAQGSDSLWTPLNPQNPSLFPWNSGNLKLGFSWAEGRGI